MKRGGRKFRLTGLNFAKFVNMAAARGIKLKQLQKLDTCLKFYVDERYVKAVKALADECRYDCAELQVKGVKAWPRRLLKNVGLIVGALVICAAMYVPTFYVFEVEVLGASETTAVAARNYLRGCGVTAGIRKSSVALEELSESARREIVGVAFAQAYFSGGKLCLSLVEDKEPPVGEEERSHIVAACDCIVSKIMVTSGTALVKEGDRVLKGQVLIDGYIDMGDPADPNNVRAEVEAQGFVIGKTWLSDRLVLSDTRYVRVRTGRTETRRNVDVFGFDWNDKRACGFSDYEAETNEFVFGSLFPVKVTTTTYFETETQTRTLDEGELEGEIFRAKTELARAIPEDAKVVRYWNLQKRLDNLHIIDLYYELEQDVCAAE